LRDRHFGAGAAGNFICADVRDTATLPTGTHALTRRNDKETFMAETYVVTGGGGFIGSHIAERLLAEGHRVHIVDNFSTGKRANIAHLTGDLHVFEADITDRAALEPAFEGADYVFHEAALPSVPRSIDNPLETNHV